MTIFDVNGGVIADNLFSFGDVDGRSFGTESIGITPSNIFQAPELIQPAEPERRKCSCGAYLSPKETEKDVWLCANPNHYHDEEKKRVARDKREEAKRLAEEIAQAAERAEYEAELQSGTIDIAYFWSDPRETDFDEIERTLNIVLSKFGVTAKLDGRELTFERAG